MPKWLLRTIIAASTFLVIALLSLLIFTPWAFVDNYELGYRFNMANGKITVLNRAGYHGRTPIIEEIHTIDLRPRQVCINAGPDTTINRRVLNCKLVEFNPEGLDLFLSWHGRGDYEGDTLNDLLKIYAYDGSDRTYPFLIVKDETNAAQVQVKAQVQ